MRPEPAEGPYPGLRAFDRNDAPYYCGRDEETNLLVAHLFASPLTLIYGRTGIGKTSMLRAGVLEALAHDDDAVTVWFADWQGRTDEARNRLRRAVSAAFGGEETDRVTLPDAIRSLAERSQRHVMLLLDQFEEYFVYHPQGHELDAELAEAMNLSRDSREPGLPASFLVSMREDGLAGMDRFRDDVPGLFRNHIRFRDLERDRAAEAIEAPLASYRKLHGVEIVTEPGLVDVVLDDLVKAGGRGVWWFEQIPDTGRVHAPHLQLVMNRIWELDRDSDPPMLSISTFRSQGGADGIVHSHVNRQLNALRERDQEVASQAFRFLVTPSGAKWALGTSDLETFTGFKARRLSGVLERLVRAKWILRRVGPPPGGGEVRYELVHDVLAAGVIDWREQRITKFLADAQKDRAGSLEVLATLQERYELERRAGRLSDETKVRRDIEWAAFERVAGKIVEQSWGGRSTPSVVMAMKPAPLVLRAFGLRPRYALSRVGDVRSDAIGDLLRRSSALAGDVNEVLRGEPAQRLLHELLQFEARTARRPPPERLRAAPGVLDELRRQFDIAADRSTRTAYLRGVGSSLTVLTLLAATAAIVRPELAGWVQAAILGALVASASVVVRLGGPPAEQGALLGGVTSTAAAAFGAMRPVIGGVLALAAYFALRPLLPWILEPAPILGPAIAGLAGLGERAASDVIAGSGRQHPEKARLPG